MEHCRFRNTEIDLGDCVKAMEEAYSVTWLDEDELSSLIRMRRLCEQFLEESERLLEDGEWKKIAEGMGDGEEVDSQMSWDLYSGLREQAQKRRFEEAVQVYISKTPEQRVAYQKETDALFADYRKSPFRSGKGLIYYDSLLDRVAVVEAGEKRLSGKSELE